MSSTDFHAYIERLFLNERTDSSGVTTKYVDIPSTALFIIVSGAILFVLAAGIFFVYVQVSDCVSKRHKNCERHRDEEQGDSAFDGRDIPLQTLVAYHDNSLADSAKDVESEDEDAGDIWLFHDEL